MDDDRYKGLSESERQAMRAMASDARPRESLEDDTVRVLARHGLIGSRKRGIVMKVSFAVGTMVAVALIFVAGVTVGQKRGGDGVPVAGTQTAEKQYMLLLYTTSSGQQEAPDEAPSEAMLAIIDEYRQWGVKMAEQGRLLAAEKLKDSGMLMAGNAAAPLRQPDDGRVLGGYFLITASSVDQARELASTHPHLKYGGEIEIRPLDLHD